MKKFISMMLFTCMLVFSFGITTIADETVAIDPVQLVLVDVLSWVDAPRDTFNTILKGLLTPGATVSDKMVTDAAALLKANGGINTVKTMTNADVRLALEGFSKGQTSAKQIYTEREMTKGYSEVTQLPNFTFTGIRENINLQLTGDKTNDNGIKFTTLFLREMVYVNSKTIANPSSSSLYPVALYDGSNIDFYLNVKIDKNKRNLIVRNVNGLIAMLPTFSKNVLGTYGKTDSTISGLDDSNGYVGKFLAYTDEQINKGTKEEIDAFYKYLRASKPAEGDIITEYIPTPTPGGGGGGDYTKPTTSPTTTPASTATPTPTTAPTATPTPTTSPEATPTPIAPTTPPDYQSDFTDITEEDRSWAGEAIDYLAYSGILKGVSENKFAPRDGVKRGDLALIMVRIFNLSSEGKESFADVSTDSYYAEACRIGKNTGILLGVDDGNVNYQPERIITREEMMALIVRSIEVLKKIDSNIGADVSMFKDADEISPYAVPYIAYLNKNGVIEGDQNGNVRPTSETNRAEAAVMIYRLYKLGITATFND